MVSKGPCLRVMHGRGERTSFLRCMRKYVVPSGSARKESCSGRASDVTVAVLPFGDTTTRSPGRNRPRKVLSSTRGSCRSGFPCMSPIPGVAA
eukprot:scaffold1449_cov244-Pinguiococcus_pyrenoidosus.AAC.18